MLKYVGDTSLKCRPSLCVSNSSFMILIRISVLGNASVLSSQLGGKCSSAKTCEKCMTKGDENGCFWCEGSSKDSSKCVEYAEQCESLEAVSLLLVFIPIYIILIISKYHLFLTSPSFSSQLNSSYQWNFSWCSSTLEEGVLKSFSIHSNPNTYSSSNPNSKTYPNPDPN